MKHSSIRKLNLAALLLLLWAHSAAAERIDNRTLENPSPAPEPLRALLATGAGPGGGPHVVRFQELNQARPVVSSSFFAFAPEFPGGAAVALADVTGDGVPETFAATSQGHWSSPQTAEVRVFDGITGAQLASVRPTGNKTPLYLAAGDLTGDAKAELVVGFGAGELPKIQVWNLSSLASPTKTAEFLAYSDGFRGGVRVAIGQGPAGRKEIWAVPGPGGGPHVRGFLPDGTDSGLSYFWSAGETSGAYIASGDLDGNGQDEILISRDASSLGNRVMAFRRLDIDAAKLLNQRPAPYLAFTAYEGFGGGVTIACADTNGDGKAEVITGAFRGGGPHVRSFNVAAGNTIGMNFFAYQPEFTGGVYVAGTVFRRAAP